jgi:hypothetical protein
MFVTLIDMFLLFEIFHMRLRNYISFVTLHTHRGLYANHISPLTHEYQRKLPLHEYITHIYA